MSFSRVAQDREALRDFWVVYEAREPSVREATLALAKDHPVFGPMLEATPPERLEAQSAESRQRLARAMATNDWTEYVASLEAQGTLYARSNVPFASWLDVVCVLQRVMVPALVEAYLTEPERLARATQAMLDFVDAGMAIIAERYAAVREEDRFRVLVESIEDYAVVMLDAEGRVSTWNAGARALAGWTSAEIVGQPSSLFYLPEERDTRPARVLGTARRTGRCTDEGWRVRKDGSRFWASVVVTAIRDPHGDVVGYSKVTRDLTDRRLAEELLRTSEESLATTLHCIGDGVIATDDAGFVTRMNPVAERLTGWTFADARARPFSEVFRIVNEKTGEAAVDPIARVLREGVTVGLANHTSLVAKDGSVRPIADSAAPIRDARGGMRGVVLVFRDMTDERAAELALRDALTFLDSVVENIPDMIFVKDAADLRFVRFNRAGEELLGATRADLLGKNDYDLFPAEQADAFTAKDREVLASSTVVDVPEEPIDTPRGRRWLHTKKIPLRDEHGAPRWLLGISEDVTERKALMDRVRRINDELEQRVAERTAQLQASEEQLRHSQKMDAVGRLAGGVAHDFNNLLSVILSYSDLMSGDLPAEDPVHEGLREIRRAAQRAADLTGKLLAFSRQQVLAPKVVNLNHVVSGMDAMLGRLIGEDVVVRGVLAQDIGSVLVDPGQIEQVIMNLVVNARDAMPTGGELTIETANVELDETHAADHAGAAPGAHVQITVSDTGVGMDEVTRARIFEPFFTTKTAGKGTGLGLSTVFGIVRQSGGHIEVHSEVGRGTTFHVSFPRVAGEADPGATTRPAERPRGTETILLVEDEEQVRSLVRAVLVRQGYTVLVASNGPAAIELAERHPETIDLLLTDAVMPKMSGRQLAERLGPLRPRMKVLFMSGYTDDVVIRHGVLASSVAFLQKPITPDLLARKVREVLEE